MRWNQTQTTLFVERYCAVPAADDTRDPLVSAQGPLYFLSRGLAERLVLDEDTVARAAAALESTDVRRWGGVGGVPKYAENAVWEDVWVGYALSRLSPPPLLGLVTIGWSNLYSEQARTPSAGS